MRRSLSSFERHDPLFEHSALPVSLSRFPLFKQTHFVSSSSAGTAMSSTLGLRQHVSNATEQSIFLTVRVLAGIDTSSHASDEPLLRVEVVGEDYDPMVLYLAEISLESFAQIKDDQQLRVNFEGFSLQMVQLLEKCQTSPDFKLALTPAQPIPATSDDGSNTSNMITLNVFETTSFRELVHLSLSIYRANESQTRHYLWERLRQESKRAASLVANLKKSETDYENKAQELVDALTQVEALKLQLNSERTEFQASLERRHAEALKEARLEVSDEERQQKEKQSLKILELEHKVKSLEEELSQTKHGKAEAEAEVLRRSGASDALGPLRTEVTELRARCRELESRAFEESSRSARLQEHIAGLEKELGQKQDSISRTDEHLRSERERIAKFTEETEEMKSRYRELDSRLAASDADLQSKTRECDQLAANLEQIKSKIATKNLVIREQERVIQEHERNIQQLQADGHDLENKLSVERTKNTELRTKIHELKQHLEESAKMLEANASVISYLNRELSTASTPSHFLSSFSADYSHPPPTTSSSTKASKIPGSSAKSSTRL